ncbi:MAG TPA: NAD-dependent epimerase/dehydratase family protein [Phycisphaerales bacterium]|nr:NAD-dependent epimerase/dehydratase family protein [Phycisphaerales bacterium]
MTTSRRSFLRASAFMSGAAALGLHGLSPGTSLGMHRPARRARLRILILGGTGFLGPACMESALAAGHEVTLFNRGARETMRRDRGRPSLVPDGVEVLYGNRDPEKTADDWKQGQKHPATGEPIPMDPDSPRGLTQLEGRTWDAVIDTSAYFPRIARASAQQLEPHIGQYLFISTISVYKRNDTPGADESAELNTLSDPATEEFGAGFENYGGGKALCEQAVQAACPGKATIVRPGYIVGPRDTTRRFNFWPWRVSRGGAMIVPGDETDPVQFIDVRDLADWCVRLIERRTVGVFNATGPATELSMRSFVEQTAAGLGTRPETTWIPVDFLQRQALSAGGEQKINPMASWPIYIPPVGEYAGFHRVSVARAVSAGLTFRSCADTVRATMEWVASLADDVRPGVLPPEPGLPGSQTLSPEREKEIIEAWKAQG